MFNLLNKSDGLTSGTDSSSKCFSTKSFISLISFSWKTFVSANTASAYLENNDSTNRD